MFSVAYSAGTVSLGNKDFKDRYNKSSKEMPETWVELQQWEQQKLLLTGAAMSGICISADQINLLWICTDSVTTYY